MQDVMTNSAAIPEPAPAGATDWKRTAATVCAILLAVVYLVSGGWKVLSPFRTGELLEQAKVPAGLGALGAAALGTLELFAAFLLLMPRFRRWGGLLGSALLIFFIGWVGYYYQALAGQECSCFPIIKRTIGPGFFVSDGVMLLLGLAAFAWSPKVTAFRAPLVAFVSLVVAAGASFGVNAAMLKSAQVPNPVIVDGAPQNLNRGKVFLFFYDPSCMHCDAASKFMSQLNWGDTRIVAVPTVNPQWAAAFLHDTHLRASTSLDLDKLKKAFPFGDPPYAVAIEDGQAKARIGTQQFNSTSMEPELKRLGFLR
jgi:uncharacterized membrane protein YphA (DoxX/SURF4 family)